MKRRFLIVVLIIVAGIGAYSFVAIPATTSPHGSESKTRFKQGPFAVNSEAFSATDKSRSTQAYKTFPGRPLRELQGQLWRPVGLQQPGPLLIYSHGFLSFHLEGLYLARFLASHGYTVLAVNYPLTGFSAPEGALMRDVVNQPGDISFLIDTLLQRNADPTDTLHASIDPQRIAVAGTSLGGLTTIMATFHRQLRDPRIAAAISIAGPTSMFTTEFFSTSDVPLLMIYGDADAIVPYAENATPVLTMHPASILVSLRDASHTGFAQPASTLMRFVANPDVIGCRAVQEALKDELAAQQDAFVAILGNVNDGVNPDTEVRFCTSPPIPIAMQAARQQMFTSLAAYAFLQSVFAADAAARSTAQRYLLETFAAENSSEVAVFAPTTHCSPPACTPE